MQLQHGMHASKNRAHILQKKKQTAAKQEANTISD